MTKGVHNEQLMRPYAASIQRVHVPGGYRNQMRETIRRIGSAIRKASVYPPIRNHAAAIASTARPKDFVGQLRAVYNDFIHRWRYVKDPASRELLTNSPEAIWRLTMGGDGVGVGAGKGAGDCDCAATALGAMLESIGFKTRLGTTADRAAPPGQLFGHVFIQAQIPGAGWVTVDPVLHPRHPFGATAKHSRIAWWNLDGKFLGYRGNYTGMGQDTGQEQEATQMLGANIEEWQDYGLGAVTEPEGSGEPVEWSMLGLNDWGWMDTPQGKISTIATYGYIDGAQLNGMAAEVDQNDDWGGGLVRTPMIELAIDDYNYVVQNGQPYEGMLGLGDTGEVYYYDGSLGRGFFRKMFKKVKRKVKKVARRVKRGIKKVLKKSKFGRFLLKVGGKIKKIAMKIVKPLIKFVGKYAAKLAPIAALIPGFGPAVAGGLMVAGKIAKTMQKWGVRTKGAAGKVRGLALKNPKNLPGFQKDLKRQAAQMKAWSRRNPKKFAAMSRKLAR